LIFLSSTDPSKGKDVMVPAAIVNESLSCVAPETFTRVTTIGCGGPLWAGMVSGSSTSRLMGTPCADVGRSRCGVLARKLVPFSCTSQYNAPLPLKKARAKFSVNDKN
jgi:hypothetical protein